MTLLVMEGFEGYGDRADLRRRHSIIQSGVATLIAGRHGGQALLLNTNNTCEFTGFGTPTTFTYGVAVLLSGGSINTLDLIRTFDGIIEQITVQLLAGGTLRVLSQAAVIGTANVPIMVDNWQYLELQVFIDDVGSYELRLDGVNILSNGSVDTRTAGSNASIDRVQLNRISATSNETYDDFYLLDDAGLTNNDFLGDIQIETMFPDSDGNRNNFTRVGGGLNNFEAVDDGNSPDDDTTYNHSATLDDDELYGHAAMTAAFDTVYAIQVRNHCRKENAGERQVRALIRSNVSEAEGAAQVLSVDWRYKDHIFETDPQGGGAWTETRINALEAGFTIEA
jgi:hypothetical protein